MYDVILFDLDGTLTDPGEGITNSVAYALRKFGIEVPDRRALYKFIGPPLYESFMKYYGFDRAGGLAAVEAYREYYRDRGIWENRVYDGIPALLAELKAAGKTLVLGTSKPEEFAERILEHFALRQYFDFVAGSTMDSARVAKADVLKYALESLHIAPSERVVMEAVGLACVGVLFGYGDRPELERAGAAEIAADVPQLRKILLG